jgi:hypothetical protein
MVVERRHRVPRAPVTPAADFFRPEPPPIASMTVEVIVEDVRRREFRCSVCGASWTGEPKRGCACGMKVGNRDAGVRCVRNESPGAGRLAEFIAKEVS